MRFRIEFAEEARAALERLKQDTAAGPKCARVLKTLARLEADPRHPGLRAHAYRSKSGPGGEPVWEAYVENATPRAWRMWFFYGPDRGIITIIAIGPHPD